MIYATSLERLEFMLEAFIEELGKMRLEVNPKDLYVFEVSVHGIA